MAVPKKRRLSLRTIGLIAVGVTICVCGVIGSRGRTTIPPTAQPSLLVAPAEPSATPAPAVTREPTRTRAPTRTPAPAAATVAPVATEAPALPTAEPPTAEPPPAPTAEPLPAAPAVTPVFTGDGGNRSVDPPWWPCNEGQIKGNRNSDKYHVPGGNAYARTFRDVRCFDTAAEAEAAGFTAVQN